MKKEERWEFVDIIGIEKLRYQVSTLGNVVDIVAQRNLDAAYDVKNGFAKVNLRTLRGNYKSFMIHLLVLQVFKPKQFKEAKKNKFQAIHKDGNIRNNELDNLDFAPRSEVRRQRTKEISKLLK